MRLRQTIGNGNPLLRGLVAEVSINYNLSADSVLDMAKTAYSHIFTASSDEEALTYSLICLSILNADTIDMVFVRHRKSVQTLADGLETEITALSLSFGLEKAVLVTLLDSLVKFFPDPLEVLGEGAIADISKFILETFLKGAICRR